MTRSTRARFFVPSANNKKARDQPGGRPAPVQSTRTRSPLAGGDDIGQDEVRMDQRPWEAVAVVERSRAPSQRGTEGPVLGREPVGGGIEQPDGRRDLLGRPAVGQ